MNKIRIGDRWVGEGEPCFIIAEAGSNHNGNIQQALKLIDVASEAGADAVKFQLFRASNLYPKSAGNSNYLKIKRPIYEIIAEMEMPYEWLAELSGYCCQRDLQFLCTAFDEDSADRLDPYVNAHKIASYEMTHLPLVCHVADKHKPMIVSTGTAKLDEVNETIAAIRGKGNNQIITLQCTGCYPAPMESVNLRAMGSLREKLRTMVGLSDHSRDPLVAPLGAVALGAAVLEKHFTLDNELPGPDHRFALEPHELKTMVSKVRELELALGSGEKEPNASEMELRSFARRSVFATRSISPGERLSAENIAVLRCGNLKAGLEPKFFPELLGRHARAQIEAESAIQDGDYE